MAQAETPTMAAAASAAFGRSPIRRRAPRRAEEQGQGEQQDGAQGNHEEAIIIGDLRCLAGDLTGARLPRLVARGGQRRDLNRTLPIPT